MKLVWDALSLEHDRPSGVRRRLLALAPRLTAHASVRIICGDIWNAQEQQQLQRCELIYASTAPHGLVRRTVGSEALLRRNGAFDAGVVLLQDAQPWSAHPRLIGTVHDLRHWRAGVCGAVRRSLLTRSFERAGAIACVSSAVAGELQVVLPQLHARSVVVPNGVDPCCCAQSAVRIADPLLLWVGHLEARKDVHTAMQVVSALAQRGRALRFVCVGRGAAPLEQELQQLQKAHAGFITAEVRRNADDAQLLALFHEASVVLCPSRLEGFGLVPLEALAHGACVVASDIAAHREVLGDAALFASPSDVSGFAAACTSVLDDEILRRQLQYRAAASVARWSWDVAAQRLLEACERVQTKE